MLPLAKDPIDLRKRSPVAVRQAPLAELIEGDRRHRRRRYFVWPALVLGLVLIAVGAWALTRPRPTPMATRFRTQSVTQGDVRREVRATGHVEAVSTVSIGAEISGRLATVEVDFNDRVKKGQVLARFDRSALDAQRAQVVANVAASRAQVAQARFDLEQAGRNLNRADALFVRGAQSAQEHDTAATASRLATSRLHAAEAQQDAQEAAAQLARTNLDHAIIRAPIDGVVITRNVDPGQTVASMLQTPVLFSVAADLKKMRIIAAIDEADIGEVAVGQKATSTVTAYGDRVFDGVVTEVRNSPVVVQDVVTYGAVVVVDNPDLALRPGMTATVRVLIASATATQRVPNAALHFTPPGEQRGPTSEVWALGARGPHRIAVRGGVSDGELTAIEGGAVAAGTVLITELTAVGRRTYGVERTP